jgi:hypothetical protein
MDSLVYIINSLVQERGRSIDPVEHNMTHPVYTSKTPAERDMILSIMT